MVTIAPTPGQTPFGQAFLSRVFPSEERRLAREQAGLSQQLTQTQLDVAREQLRRTQEAPEQTFLQQAEQALISGQPFAGLEPSQLQEFVTGLKPEVEAKIPPQTLFSLAERGFRPAREGEVSPLPERQALDIAESQFQRGEITPDELRQKITDLREAIQGGKPVTVDIAGQEFVRDPSLAQIFAEPESIEDMITRELFKRGELSDEELKEKTGFRIPPPEEAKITAPLAEAVLNLGNIVTEGDAPRGLSFLGFGETQVEFEQRQNRAAVADALRTTILTQTGVIQAVDAQDDQKRLQQEISDTSLEEINTAAGGPVFDKVRNPDQTLELVLTGTASPGQTVIEKAKGVAEPPTARAAREFTEPRRAPFVGPITPRPGQEAIDSLAREEIAAPGIRRAAIREAEIGTARKRGQDARDIQRAFAIGIREEELTPSVEDVEEVIQAFERGEIDTLFPLLEVIEQFQEQKGISETQKREREQARRRAIPQRGELAIEAALRELR